MRKWTRGRGLAREPHTSHYGEPGDGAAFLLLPLGRPEAALLSLRLLTATAWGRALPSCAAVTTRTHAPVGPPTLSCPPSGKSHDTQAKMLTALMLKGEARRGGGGCFVSRSKSVADFLPLLVWGTA